MVPEAHVHPSSQAVFSRDGRTLAYSHIDKGEFVVRFFDTSQGKELGSCRIKAENVEIDEIRDVPPHRAWTWSLGTVVALMMLLFTVSRSLRAYRNRKVAASAKRQTTARYHSFPVQ